MTIRQVAINLRTWLSIPVQRHMASCQQGAVLMMTIIAVTIAASLGTAIYSFVSTSALTQVGSMNDTKAYYLAESGGHYAVKRLTGIDSSNATVRNALLTELAASPYTVTDAGQFVLQSFSYTTSGGFAQFSFSAKGIPTDASISRTISYIVKVPDQGGINIPFDGTGPTLNSDNWNKSGSVALDTANQKVTLNSGVTSGQDSTQVSLDWNNPNSTLPDLADVWTYGNGMLTYEIQAKVKLYSNNSDDVAAGISFRLKTQGDTTFSNDSFYGLSYVWCYDRSDTPALCGSDTNKTFIVLWKQQANGTQTVIGKQLASTVATSLVSSGKLVSWATLVVRVQEQLNTVTGVRENLISAFVGDPVTYPKGTIHWDYTKFAVVKWQSAFSGTDCSGGLKSSVADADFLTTNFNTQPQDEIGVHTLGGTMAEVADLAVRFNFAGGEATNCVTGTPGTLYFKSATYSVSEGSASATITVGRQNGSVGTVGVSYATTSGGTATAGSDYTTTSGTLSWTEGDTADKTFTIPIVNDSAYESNETINLAITSATGGAVLGTPNTAVLTINDNDGIRVLNAWPSTAIKSGTSSSMSGTFATSVGTDRFLVCAVTSELSDVTSSFSVSGNYGGQNFTTIKSTGGLSTRQHVWLGYVKESQIAARSNDTVSVSISADRSTNGADLYCGSYEGVEQSNPVAGSRANYNSGSSTVSFGGNVSVVNGGYIFYALAANGASSTPPSGYLEHWDRSANSYSTSGASKRITSTGSENRSWSLNSSDRWGLAVASLNPTAGGGSPGTIDFSATAYSVNEDGGTVIITATRTGGSTGAVSVNYATSNGTATAGSDYTSASGTLSWANGDSANKTFTVSITNDSLFESAETINLTLSNPTGGVALGDSSAILTIVDNDNAAAVTALNSWLSLDTGTSSSMSGSFTTSSGTNRLLVCSVTAELSSSASIFSVSGNYGGRNFTTLTSTSGSGNRQHVWLGYLKESDIAARSSNSVSVSISSTQSTSAADLYCGSYQYVNQASPITNSLTNSNASGSSTVSFGGNVTVDTGGYIIYALATNEASSSSPSGYVEHWDKTVNGYSTSGASKAITIGGVENKSWSLTSSERWGLAIGSLRP